MTFRRRFRGGPGGAGPGPPGAAASDAPDIELNWLRLSRTFRHCELRRSPFQPFRLAHWVWLNGIGGRLSSSTTWTRLPRWRAYSASARTHWDFSAAADQRTTTASDSAR